MSNANPSVANLQIDSQVSEQAIDFLFQDAPNAVISLLIASSLLLYVMWPHVNHITAAAWGVAMLLVVLGRAGLLILYRTRCGRQEMRQWARYFTLTALVTGTLVGSAGVIFLVPESALLQFLLLAFIAGLVIFPMMMTAYWIPVFFAFSMPAVILPSVYLVTQGNSAYLALALMMLVFYGCASRIAVKNNRMIRSTIRLKLANRELAEKLREQQVAVEQGNHSRSRILAAAGHDLRQPLHAMNLFVGLLETCPQDSTGSELVRKIKRSLSALDRLLGHHIDLDSRVGNGSVSGITLPAVADGQPAPQCIGEAPVPGLDLSGLCVVVVDDHRDIRDGMRETLQAWGCDAIVAASGTDAIARIADTGWAPDVVIADYHLRVGETGSCAAREICQAIGKAVPVLLVTGDTSPERISEAHNSAFTLLHKPIQPARLRLFLQRIRLTINSA